MKMVSSIHALPSNPFHSHTHFALEIGRLSASLCACSPWAYVPGDLPHAIRLSHLLGFRTYTASAAWQWTLQGDMQPQQSRNVSTWLDGAFLRFERRHRRCKAANGRPLPAPRTGKLECRTRYASLLFWPLTGALWDCAVLGVIV